MASSPDIQIISVIGANGQPLPIHGNSIGSTWSDNIKQERADEAEIRELAAKMVEKQKENLARQQQQAAQQASRQANGMQAPLPPGANGQTNILNFLSRQQKLPNGTIAPAVNGRTGNGTATPNSNGNNGTTTNNGDTTGGGAGDDKKAPCDEESQKGHFGWTTIAKTHIPYIFRQQEKYCSVRMIEYKLLNKFLNALHSDIYSCTHVRSYYITEAEARLFLEINNKHCDGEFGREMFTQKDLVVRLSDANKFYQFLDICYRKLISGSKSVSEKCGFIRINKESVVPYTLRNNEQVVPLFYFEGETENLKQKADYLSGWDLAYLKFCCKVQGIRNELFSSENVAVISLTDIKSYFPNGTEFEDYWPSKVVDSNLLIGNRATVNNSVNWTRQPAHPPPKVMSQSNVNQKNAHSLSTMHQQHQQQQQQQQQMKRGAAAAVNTFAQVQAAAAMQQQTNASQRMHSNNALATVQALSNGSWMSHAPNNLQMFHTQMLQAQQQAAAAQSHQNSRAQYRNPMESLLLGNRQQYAAYNNAAISMQPVNSHGQGNAPPPLVRSAAGQNQNHMSNIEQTLLQQQTQQQQRHISAPSSSMQSSSSNNKTNSNSSFAASSLNNVQNAMPNASTNLLNNKYNVSATATPTPSSAAVTSALFDYANLAFWNHMTPQQRLLLTQQVKSGSLDVGKNSFLSGLPTLPVDTEVTTVFDYNSNKKSKSSSSGGAQRNNSSAFTKPNAPPVISVASLDGNTNSKRSRDASLSAIARNGTTAASSNNNTVSLNSSTALEDFEKRFKMTEEMKAVVQKVLSNPDLSTYVQTNSSNTFEPFISPPISPATGANNSLSIIPSPSVTITPQLPNDFIHSPSGSSSSLTTGGNMRHKSVICSTSARPHVPPSPSTSSHSNSTPSPSPTRLANISNTSSSCSSTSNYKSAFPPNRQSHQQQQQQQQQQQLHYQQNSTSSMEVIDLSSPRRSLQANSNYIQQQQAAQHQAALAAAQQQRLAAAAAAQHNAQQNGRGATSSSSASNAAAAAAAAHSASLHLQRHAVMAAAAAADSAVQRLCVIPEIQTNNAQAPPYKIQKVYVESTLVPCINMKHFNDSDQLMTLTDFQKYFFPSISLEHCKRLIEALGVELYKGNRKQTQILMEYDRNHNENIPLVQVRDVIRYMTQLTFMIQNQNQPPSKRSRVS